MPSPRLRSLVRAGERTEHISLDLVQLESGAALALEPSRERVIVILSGRAGVSVDGRELGTVGGREDVFEAPADALYLPDSAAAVLAAGGGAVMAAVASAPAGDLPQGGPRIIASGEQGATTAGRDSWRRTVRTILGPKDRASRLLVGETVNPPGLWSSFPPHRHDRESDEEVDLEEVYLFRVRPSNGFGVQVRYDSDAQHEARMVRDLDVSVISSGFHPVAAAPGHDLYYLWVMAGEGRQLRPYIDPRYRWVDERR